MNKTDISSVAQLKPVVQDEMIQSITQPTPTVQNIVDPNVQDIAGITSVVQGVTTQSVQNMTSLQNTSKPTVIVSTENSMEINTSKPPETKNNCLNLKMERCYAIDEETYACVSLNLSSRQGLQLSNKTKDLIRPSELPSNLTCHKVMENKEGVLHSASVCTTDEKNIKNASDQIFSTFIPSILSNI
tara:strand:- start:305 stop:865 length:561 start_codon:yes stop_codon:yes gene_type:complete